MGRRAGRLPRDAFRGSDGSIRQPLIQLLEEVLDDDELAVSISSVARVTLARKLAALTLRLLKTGEVFDLTQLNRPQT